MSTGRSWWPFFESITINEDMVKNYNRTFIRMWTEEGITKEEALERALEIDRIRDINREGFDRAIGRLRGYCI